MAFDKFANFAWSMIVGSPVGITTAVNVPGSTGSYLTVTAGTGSRFAVPPFNAVVFNAFQFPLIQNWEVVRVTAAVGDTFTVLRQQEGTQARNIAIGDTIMQFVTNKLLTDIENAIGAGGGNVTNVAATAPVGNGVTAGDDWWNTATNERWGWTGAAWQQYIFP